MQNYLIKPIGVVRNDYKEASLTLQKADLELDEKILTRTNKDNISEFVINQEYEDCLDGIEDLLSIKNTRTAWME